MRDRTVQVCYVIPSLGIGGTESQLIQLMRNLTKDHEMMVVCTRGVGDLAGDARRLGAVRVLGLRGGWDPRLRGRIVQFLRNYRPDIVHTFMFGFDYQVNAAARKVGIPVVISSRRQLATWKKPRHLRLQRKANALVDCIVANSRAVAEFACEQEGGDPGLYRVIPNGIDVSGLASHRDLNQVRLQYQIPFHTQVIGIVANFSPVKDHDLFIEIASKLAQRRADIHFILVGNGPLRERTEHRIRELKLADRITTLSTVSEMPDLYRLMSVSLLCSKVEGFPNAVMESMAAGVPVVASAVGGIPELIDDGVSGKLVGSRDPEDYAQAVDWILANPEESRRMAAAAMEHVRTKLSVERMGDAYRRLYAELLGNAPKRKEAR